MRPRHHHQGHPADRQHRRRFGLVLAITLLFFLIEAIGGWLTGSLALLADASHLLGDVGALSLALVAMWLVGRPATHAKTYGYHRAEILAALFNGLALWLIAGLIWHEAYQRLFAQPPIQTAGMTVIAALGLLANLVSYFFLSTMPRQTLNTRTAMLHLVGDIMGSVGALAAGLIIWATGWTVADPLASFLIGGLILATSWGVVKESIDVLMEATPKGVDPAAIMTALGTVPGLEAVHDLHVWSLRSGVHALTVHGVIAEDCDDADMLHRMTRLLAERFDIHHTTIQLDRRPALVQIDQSARMQ
ncbi:MAG: cation diffusion facilitator family transporter [Nitrospirota bacterium]